MNKIVYENIKWHRNMTETKVVAWVESGEKGGGVGGGGGNIIRNQKSAIYTTNNVTN